MRIELKQISKAFDGKQVIKPTDLIIEDGKFTTLLGPSGCGKTTLLRMISGLETPDDGEIYFDGICIFSKERKINIPPEKRKLGFVFQDFALWPHMTVFENVAFGLRASKDLDNLNARVMEALKSVRLEGYENRYPHQLSGGQQQRVAFARAIVIKPGCILFDEPLSALDALLREEMRCELREITNSLRITSVFVTHDQMEAMSMSDKIAVLNEGVIEQCDTPENIYKNPVNKFVGKFIGKSNWLSKSKMFRPESVEYAEKEGYSKYELLVKNCRYLGDSYEIAAIYEDTIWNILSKEKLISGDNVSIYLNPKEIISFEEKEV